jgi:hypothetical protein
MSRGGLPDFSHGPDTARLFGASFLSAAVQVKSPIILREMRLKICVELQKQGGVAIANFAFRERCGWSLVLV